jgi:hypothetical protein
MIQGPIRGRSETISARHEGRILVFSSDTTSALLDKSKQEE